MKYTDWKYLYPAISDRCNPGGHVDEFRPYLHVSKVLAEWFSGANKPEELHLSKNFGKTGRFRVKWEGRGIPIEYKFVLDSLEIFDVLYMDVGPVYIFAGKIH